MKGVILAGGLGSRLYPLTYATNKHLLPVYDKPMVYYPIKTLVDAGINEILIVTGGPHAGHFMRVLRNGKELGIKHLEYAYQETEGGISDALRLADDFSDKENISFDNVKNINFNLSGSAKIVWKLDVSKFTTDLLGQPKKDFNQILSKYENIDFAMLELNFPWVQSVPAKSQDIKVIINYPQ